MTVSKSLVLTVIGNDRPGIVNQVSDVARRFDANWAGSRMASLAGQFAGIVHFQVPDENAQSLADAFRALDSSGLHVLITMPESAAVPGGAADREAGARRKRSSRDRPGPFRQVSWRRGVSIEELHTEFVVPRCRPTSSSR
jgi:glycine cleavage system regulatory protein